jgi:Glyoxalase-like domain
LAQQAALGNLQCVVLDCSDVLELAGFYQALLGGSVNQAGPRWAVSDNFSTLHTSAGLVLAFQRVPDYRPPR